MLEIIVLELNCESVESLHGVDLHPYSQIPGDGDGIGGSTHEGLPALSCSYSWAAGLLAVITVAQRMDSL